MSSILRKIKLKNYHHHYNSRLHWNLIKTHNYHSSEGVFGFKPRKVSQVSFNADILKNRHQNAHIVQLVDAFRSKGHLLAPLNPLQIVTPRNESVLEVDLNNLNDEQAQVNTHGILNIGKESCKVNEILSFLRRTYCSPAAVEFMHIECPNEREWVANRWESLSNDFALNENEMKNIAKTLLKSEIFDQFVGTKFSSVKRYGGEGAESMMIFFGELFRLSALNEKVTDLVVGMPHRGRLNFMVGLLNYPPVIMFQKMKGLSEFDLSSVTATGDVLSHLFTSVDLKFDNQHDIHVSVLPNPSHLEAICPAAAGKARGKAMSKSVGQYGTENGHISPILAIQGHGDAAITGQGVVMETLSMANVPHFSVDGSIHLIGNFFIYL
jgi:probable 2-oxoglutarate dehydrogenase E1 component DHKTD1